jgi:hypothetical protein
MIAAAASEVQIVDSLLSDRYWRMNNLYWIQDKSGQVVPFRMNESQAQFWHDMWWLNVILKDRQRGFSTEIAIFILDSCVFKSSTQAGIIDITLPDAKKKLDKIRFAYDRLPEDIREACPMITDAKESLEWINGSRVDVSTSHRGGTLQILHVSEYGKIAARKPEVAREIRTGAFNTVGPENFIFVESTAEGSEGDYYEMCQEAQRLRQEGLDLTTLDFKFHFFGWWMGTENQLPPHAVAVSPEINEYLDKVESVIGEKITPAKRAWYAKKSSQQRDDMKREFPSTPQEAFESAVDGSYFSKEMAKVRIDGRITDVPYDQGFPVDTFWDLGMDDSMTIWFRQRIGSQNRIIDYLENSGEGLAFYAKEMNKKGYLYGTHYFPHDIAVRELGTGVARSEKAIELGIKPIVQVDRPRDIEAVLAGIEACRTFLSTCVFDRTKTIQGVKCLDNYKKQWDEKRSAFARGPFHNWASHGADSFRTGAVALRRETDLIPSAKAAPSWRDRLIGAGPNGGLRPRGAMVA